MSRVYARREDNGERHLVAIQCDSCGEEIAPCSGIAESGWMLAGFDHGPGTDKFEQDYCPTCWSSRR
jgi:hypothetical protein